MFVDRVKVNIKAGDGGDGAVSFHHEKFRAKGGPDGGDGGDGGDVVLVASRNQNTLAAFRYKKLLKAESGSAGSRAKRHGKDGVDLVVPVPVGTTVILSDGGSAPTESSVLADLAADGQTAVIARGGKGGFGNAHFVSSTRQAPRVAEQGEHGQELEATLELKMIADVGIVGLPNAGKSTFLSVVSNAHPEIADYPFTTLTPNLGVVDIEGGRSLLLADIPGLIAGASQGKGLGDEFLRHVERTSLLLHLIDVYNEDVAVAYQIILRELAEYRVDLSKRPQVIALTKVEGVDKKQLEQKLKVLKKLAPKDTPVLVVSSPSGLGIKEVLRALQKQVDAAAKRQAKTKKKPGLPVISFTPAADTWQIKKLDDGFIITGKKLERFARRTKFGDYHGEQRLRDIMARMGITRELARQGVESGQILVIGDPEIGRLVY